MVKFVTLVESAGIEAPVGIVFLSSWPGQEAGYDVEMGQRRPN
jgi:hypothetical protein